MVRPKSRRTTDATRAVRNRHIVARRLEGAKWQDIADEFGMSLTRVREVFRDHQAAGGSVDPLTLQVDPNALLMRVVADHEFALDRLRALSTDADNASAAVGAAKGLAAVGVQLVELLRSIGLAPSHGVSWPTVEEWADIAEELGRAASEAGLDASRIAAAVEAVRARHGLGSRVAVGVVA